MSKFIGFDINADTSDVIFTVHVNTESQVQTPFGTSVFTKNDTNGIKQYGICGITQDKISLFPESIQTHLNQLSSQHLSSKIVVALDENKNFKSILFNIEPYKRETFLSSLEEKIIKTTYFQLEDISDIRTLELNSSGNSIIEDVYYSIDVNSNRKLTQFYSRYSQLKTIIDSYSHHGVLSDIIVGKMIKDGSSFTILYISFKYE